MKTPDTLNGRLTEKVMAKLRKRFPKMETHTYNAFYSAVLESLEEEFSEAKLHVLPDGTYTNLHPEVKRAVAEVFPLIEANQARRKALHGN